MNPFLLLIVGIAIIIICILFFRIHPILSLLIAAISIGVLTSETNLLLYTQVKGLSEGETSSFMAQSTAERILIAFWNTFSKIGILIAMASVIGSCLLHSGGADKIVNAMLSVFGEKRAPLAFLSSGFIIGIPVFFDSVFYLLIPIIKAMTLRTGKNYVLYLITIIAGASMAHSLVPPTPGPLFVAAEMGVDIGVMILGGLVVGLFTITGGYFYAVWANNKWEIPLRISEDSDIEELNSSINALPPLWLSLIPIVLPIILISGNTISMATIPEYKGYLMTAISLLGNSNIALTLAAIVGIITLIVYIKDKSKIKRYISGSLKNAALIIMITSMGGALGNILQQTGIGAEIQVMAINYQIALLPVAFFVTFLLRTAQGSATVAMITSVGIIGGIINVSSLAFHPVYLALAIGCGSKPFQWMNDSGFWIICKMSGLTIGETIKTSSYVLILMGFIGLLVIIVLAKLFPFV